MGRGPRQQAAGAAGLLFGPRRSGSGPSAPPEPSRPSVDNLADLVTAVAVEAGLVRDLNQTGNLLKENGFFVAENTHGAATVYLRPAQDDEDVNGVRINYSPGVYEGQRSNRAIAGPVEPASRDALEESLRKPLKDAGFGYIEMTMSGQEALDRFDRGEKIDLALKGDDLKARKQELKRQLLDMLDIGIIRSSSELAQVQELTALQTAGSGGEGDIFDAMAGDEAGRETLSRARHLNIRSYLS